MKLTAAVGAGTATGAGTGGDLAMSQVSGTSVVNLTVLASSYQFCALVLLLVIQQMSLVRLVQQFLVLLLVVEIVI